MTAPVPCPRCGAPLSASEPAGRPCARCLLAAAQLDSAASELSATAEARIPPAPETIAPLFPQLELLSVLGQGGMGVVYRARQKELGREVALKLLWGRAGADAALSERFLREARAMARLAHPNIVGVHDFGRAGEHLYLVLELVEGTNLRQLLKPGRLEPAQALAIVAETCAALQYAHDQGVVHRDIKPENILLDRAGHVKIADFGLAKLSVAGASGERLTREGQAMGTPQYMAPEQLEHPLAVDHRADIFSLGVVFYELLTGELPLGRFAPPSRKVQIDVRLDAVVLRALEKEPEQRYQRASEVRAEVEDIVSQPAAPAVALPAPPKPRSAAFWIWIVAGVMALVLLPLACFATVLLFLGAAPEEHAPQVEEASPPVETGR